MRQYVPVKLEPPLRVSVFTQSYTGLPTLRRLERVFASRGDWFRVNAIPITMPHEPEMKAASLLSIYLKNLLGDLRRNFSCQ